MNEHPIQDLMTTAMENLENMVEVNTIIGDPVQTPDGSMIMPISKVGFGFAAGGSEFSPQNISDDGEETLPFGGGSGGGVSITPVAFLVMGENGVQILHIEGNTNVMDKLTEFAPQAIEKMEDMISDAVEEKDREKGKEKSRKSKDE